MRVTPHLHISKFVDPDDCQIDDALPATNPHLDSRIGYPDSGEETTYGKWLQISDAASHMFVTSQKSNHGIFKFDST